MAILINIVEEKDGFTGSLKKDNVYVVVSGFTGCSTLQVTVDFLSEADGYHVAPQRHYLIEIDKSGDNYIKQIYGYLMTLAEFKGGIAA